MCLTYEKEVKKRRAGHNWNVCDHRPTELIPIVNLIITNKNNGCYQENDKVT